MNKKENKNVIILDCGIKVLHFNVNQLKNKKNKFVTSNGYEVKELSYRSNISYFPIFGCFTDGEFCNWIRSGIHPCIDDLKLFMVYSPKKKKPKTKGWINIYACDECSNIFDTKKEAKENIPEWLKEDGSYITTIKIRY